MRSWFTTDSGDGDADCRCSAAFEGDRLVVSAEDCPESGHLGESPACRATVIAALGDADVDAVVATSDGVERAYLDDSPALLVAAGRFATRVEPIDERLAMRARREPLSAATEAAGRAGPVADLVAETGLSLLAERATAESGLDPYVGPTVSDARVATAPPANASLRDRRTVETGAVVRRYESPDALDTYHVRPTEHEFDPETTRLLAEAVDRLASAAGERVTAHEAADAVTEDGTTAAAVAAVLRKHTRGLGILEDLFADTRVSDAFATAPVADTRLRVEVEGETMRTNVRLTSEGARALASTFRRTSGRAFSRASPTLDATATVAGRRVRVAGVGEPVSDGLAFAFRAHDGTRWRLSEFVGNGTLSPAVAGLLSVAVERGAACLVAGPRGAGKTTTLGALLWELPPAVRAIVLEDTPELPVSDLQSEGRDVQPLRTASGDGPSIDAAEALRTALRLGDGALVVGEVRGEEASVLYEAMRVGSGDSAVLGTIHGSGGAAVRERLVADLGVPESAFAATDLVVTLAPPTDEAGRGVAAVEEVIDRGDGVGFEPLFERDGSGRATATGRLARGTSHLVESLAHAGESYERVLEVIRTRMESFADGAPTPVGSVTTVAATDAAEDGR
ncbi:ATPase, T2SS/T4P/T4SS family [Haloarcula nitratireducens]|uniref:Flp pilus assembly complex ATPase component TadA n=1 Tax=Haloarcula nitratireducens TaxID=2487749 RepID=A0AAW4P6G2_9EURY|nr:ATPase, T2SS/T4P/T4SS family [Halomicroarcula nitratireducens]MBX0293474.1 Flp pilus assembly complex ATPase component TadA [Halomicroarcula nitratireducens]